MELIERGVMRVDSPSLLRKGKNEKYPQTHSWAKYTIKIKLKNILVLALSVLTGVPISGQSRMTAVAKSPQTVTIVYSQCGGFWLVGTKPRARLPVKN